MYTIATITNITGIQDKHNNISRSLQIFRGDSSIPATCVLTYYRAQCRAAKCVLRARIASPPRRSPRGSIVTCSHSTPAGNERRGGPVSVGIKGKKMWGRGSVASCLCPLLSLSLCVLFLRPFLSSYSFSVLRSSFFLPFLSFISLHSVTSSSSYMLLTIFSSCFSLCLLFLPFLSLSLLSEHYLTSLLH